MSVSRAILRRRELLGALGASAFLAVPIFRQTLAEAQVTTPKRAIFFQWPDGVPSACFQLHTCPTARNAPDMAFFNMGGQLASFAPLKADTILLQNVNFPAAERGEQVGHEAGMQALLTGSQGGTSLDQYIAKNSGNLTKYASLQFGASPYAGEPNQDRIAYADGFALQQERDPVRMFNRLFANFTAPAATGSMPDPAALLRTARDKSALDFLKTEITALQSVTSSAEKPLLDMHLESLRELEKQLTQVPTAVGTACAAPNLGGVREGQLASTTSEGSGYDLQMLAKLQLDLLYQAINCDLTRVATFQWAASVEVSATYGWVAGYSAMPDQHHAFAHDHESPQNEAIYQGIQTWFLDQTAGFVARLKATAEGSGSLLDNSVVMVASEMCNGNHTMSPLPVMLAGRCGGAFQNMGQTVDAKWAAHNDLLVAIARAMGTPLTSIGDASFNGTPLVL